MNGAGRSQFSRSKTTHCIYHSLFLSFYSTPYIYLLCSLPKIASKVAFLSRATELRAHELRALVHSHYVLFTNTFLVEVTLSAISDVCVQVNWRNSNYFFTHPPLRFVPQCFIWCVWKIARGTSYYFTHLLFFITM